MKHFIKATQRSFFGHLWATLLIVGVVANLTVFQLETVNAVIVPPSGDLRNATPDVDKKDIEKSAADMWGSCGRQKYAGFPTWYRGLSCDGEGTVMIPKGDAGFIAMWKIVLNFVEMLVIAAGYIAAGFFMWGGFSYILSTGKPDKTAAAKSTLLNAVIGLVIVLASVGLLDFVQKTVLGASQ
ncbi:hypothetical protein EOL73_02295 [Candidatus Saccharibacteria bacterium]|nr:hypothetical protein [Candidatus Saccharibacteria bacterium]NCU40566.1 hypothetical protein [Candidatus Saccharibacteria bacterium]